MGQFKKRWYNQRNQTLYKNQTLHKKLKSFGLNPNNWDMIPTLTSGQYLIVNKNNQHFCLRGISSTKNQKSPQWKDIELLSI